jgi:hypothetical protein
MVHRYEKVPGVGNPDAAPVSRRTNAKLTPVLLAASLLAAVSLLVVLFPASWVGQGVLRGAGAGAGAGAVSQGAVSEAGQAGGAARSIIHISDAHVDPLFDPRMSMQPKVCHSCALSQAAYGANASCPTHIAFSNASNERELRELGYAFGERRGGEGRGETAHPCYNTCTGGWRSAGNGYLGERASILLYTVYYILYRLTLSALVTLSAMDTCANYDINCCMCFSLSAGRYGCNPPYLLWQSLLQHLRRLEPDPRVVVFTGDLSPHGYPGDLSPLAEAEAAPGDTGPSLDDMCQAKFLITRQLVRDLVQTFPRTRWAFTLGNNDHFPKNTFWQAYISKLGGMMLEEGFLTEAQHAQMVQTGSSYIDMEGVRYLCLDFTLFTITNATNHVAVEGGHDTSSAQALTELQRRVTEWTNSSLRDAKEKVLRLCALSLSVSFNTLLFLYSTLQGLAVWIVGHQPQGTAKGKDELDRTNVNFQLMKELFVEYQSIIRVGLFGHHNQAELSEVLSPSFLPLFPSLTAPGISPRGLNQPSFFILQQDARSGAVTDFEQHVFDLLDENRKAKLHFSSGLNEEEGAATYLGTWKHHEGIMRSWKTLSGEY